MKNSNKTNKGQEMTMQEILVATKGTEENALKAKPVSKVKPTVAPKTEEVTSPEVPKAEVESKNSSKVTKDIVEATKKALAQAKAETPKKTDTKVVSKPASNKAESKEVKAVEQTQITTNSWDLAKAFKEEIETPLGKARKIGKEIASIADLAKATEEGKNYVLTMYWTKRLLKQFTYDALGISTAVKEFPNDLDLIQPIYINENRKAVHCVSQYTEAMYTLVDVELAFDEEQGMRYTNGIEYNIYEIIE